MDRIDELLLEVLDQPEQQWPAAIETLARAHPADSEQIHARYAILRTLRFDRTPASASVQEFPERLGEYRLLERLGSGGMGVVYRAVQESIGRDVALKLMRPEQMYFPGARERFRREVETIARLAHQSVVAVHAVGEAVGIPFYAMEFVRGASLEQIVQHFSGHEPERLTGEDMARAVREASRTGEVTPLPELFAGAWHDACQRIVAHIADALAHAHARGVLHRDVKPANVLVTPEGRVVLVDFGLAHAQGATRLTRSNAQVGSCAYMSPEQIRGDLARIDERSDIWSLGITLYELLTLVSPHQCATLEATHRSILQREIAPLRTRNPAAQADASVVCATAMDPEPHRRYQHAADFSRDLTNVLARRPVMARPAGPVLRLRRWVQRNPALALAVLLAGSFASGTPIAISFAIARQRDRALAAEAAADRGAYAANVSAAYASLQANDAGEARRRLDLCRQDRRGFEWRHLALHCESSLFVVDEHARGLGAVTLTADARLLATADGSGRVSLRDLATRELVASIVHPRGVRRLAFVAPDRLLIVDEEQGAYVYDSTTGKPIAEARASGYRAFDLQVGRATLWCHDGGWHFREMDTRTLRVLRDVTLDASAPSPTRFTVGADGVLFGVSSRRIAVWDVATGRLLLQATSPFAAIRELVLQPDGRGVAAADELSGRIGLLDLATARTTQSVDLGRTHATALAFTPDGRQLVVSDSGLCVHTFDVSSGRKLLTMHGHSARITDLACAAADLSYVVSSSLDGTVRIWCTEATPEAVVLRRHLGTVTDLVASHDGQRLISVSEDGFGWIWDPIAVRPLGVLQEHLHHVQAAVESPDGATLITCYHDSLMIRDATAGTVLSRIPTGQDVVRRLAWSPDGNSIAIGDVHGRVAIRRAEGSTEVRRFDVGPAQVGGVAFARDGALLAGSRNGVLACWDAAGSLRWRVTDGPTECRGLRVLSCGTVVTVHATQPGLVCLRDLGTGKVLTTSATRSPLLSLGELADGSRLLTGAHDGTLTFWDPNDLEPWLNLSAQESAITAIATDPHGKWCALGSADGTCRMLRTESPPLGAVLAQAALRYEAELLSQHGSIESALAAMDSDPAASEPVRRHVRVLLSQRRDADNVWFFDTQAIDLCRQPHPSERDLQQAEHLTACLGNTPSRQIAEALLAHRRKDHSRSLRIAGELLAQAGDSLDWIRADLLLAVVVARARLGDRDGSDVALRELRSWCATSVIAYDHSALAALAEAELVLRQ